MRVTPSRLAVGLALIVAAAFIGVLVATLAFDRSDRICRGVKVSGVSVGGLTKEVAAEHVRDWARHRNKQEITFTALDKRWMGTLQDLGARIDVQDVVNRAFAVGREGSIFSRIICTLTPNGAGKQIDAKVLVDKDRIRKTISKIAKAINRQHKDARMTVVDDQLHVEQDSSGIKLNEKKTVNVIYKAMVDGSVAVSLPVEIDKPDVTAEDALGINTLLARFTTKFNPAKRDRTHNLTLAATQVNGVIIKPRQQFSYNEIVGPRVGNRGYREAPIFVNGRLEPGMGGGICQVSSTIYNTVLLTGLKVLQRGPHSRTVPYVKPGRDATVAYGWRDFKFENSNSSPIALISKVGRSSLTVDIYGAAEDKKAIEIFTSKPVYSAIAGEMTKIDPTLPAGVTKVLDVGARGVTVTVYRKVTMPGGKAVTDVVSRDKYPAQKRIIGVGPIRKAVVTKVDDSSTVVNVTKPTIQ